MKVVPESKIRKEKEKEKEEAACKTWISSFSSLSYDRSKASSKSNSPHSAI
jgi:hypothetical protein